MITVSRRLARLLPPARDLDGWMPAESDPRMPARRAGLVRLAGPWTYPHNEAAHGIFYRDTHTGLRETAIACDGWMLWRSSGPRMRPVAHPETTQPSPLISHLNPVLAQCLCLGWTPPAAVDHEEWTAEAITTGLKTAGYFSLGRRRNRAWAHNARHAGLDVAAAPGYRYLFASQPGTLGEAFDLKRLAAEYERVLPQPHGPQAAHALRAHADLPLITAARAHEDYHPAITGLALGYPPDVTAGGLLPRTHRQRHDPTAAEYGADCPHCDH